MSAADRAAINFRESLRSYHRWHFESSEVASLEASTQPPPHAHHSKSGMSRLVRMSKSIEPLEDQNYD